MMQGVDGAWQPSRATKALRACHPHSLRTVQAGDRTPWTRSRRWRLSRTARRSPCWTVPAASVYTLCAYLV